jgi:ribonuclease HI
MTRVKGEHGQLPGGWACVLFENVGVTELVWVNYGAKKLTTNNEMELFAMVEVIKMLPQTECDVLIKSDSEYVLKAIVRDALGELKKSRVCDSPDFTGWMRNWIVDEWKTAGGMRKHHELWKVLIVELKKAIKNGVVMKFQWVKGHSGERGNELVDKLSKAAYT